MICEYEDQFYIDEVTVFFYREDGKPFHGFDFTGSVYSTGKPILRRDILQNTSASPSLSVVEEIRYYVCDAAGVPVGSLRDKAYGFLGKNNIIFPRELHFNGYKFWSEAEYALGRISNYYKRIKSCKTTIKSKGMLSNLFHRVTMTEEALKRRTMRDTFEKRKREKPDPNSLIGLLASIEEEENLSSGQG